MIAALVRWFPRSLPTKMCQHIIENASKMSNVWRAATLLDMGIEVEANYHVVDRNGTHRIVLLRFPSDVWYGDVLEVMKWMMLRPSDHGDLRLLMEQHYERVVVKQIVGIGGLDDSTGSVPVLQPVPGAPVGEQDVAIDWQCRLDWSPVYCFAARK